MLHINQAAAAQLLESPETFGLVLAVILEASIDPAILHGADSGEPLDALTVFNELEARYHVKLPEAVQNRLQAVMTLWLTEAYENDVLAFTGITLALTEGYLGDLVTGTLEELDSQAVLWSLFETAAIDPLVRGLSPEIQQMVLTVFQEPQDEDEDGAREDPMNELLENLQELTGQLQELELSRQLTDQLIQRGMAALPDDIPIQA